jgi:hypothetical protein
MKRRAADRYRDTGAIDARPPLRLASLRLA